MGARTADGAVPKDGEMPPDDDASSRQDNEDSAQGEGSAAGQAHSETRSYERTPTIRQREEFAQRHLVDLSALLLLRALREGPDAQVAVGAAWAGEFGDIVVRLPQSGRDVGLIMMKVCPRRGRGASVSARELAEAPDLGVVHCLRAFERLWSAETIWAREELRGLRESALFVAYTNAAAAGPPGPAAATSAARLLRTAAPGGVRHLVPDAHPELRGPLRAQFLRRFVLCSGQAPLDLLPELLRQELALQHGLLHRHDEPPAALRAEMRRYLSLEGDVPYLGVHSAPYAAYERAVGAQTRCTQGLWMSERSLDHYAARVEEAAAAAPAAALWMPHSYPQLRTFCLVQLVRRAPSLALVQPLLVARAADVVDALAARAPSALDLWKSGGGLLVLDAEGVPDCPRLQAELAATLADGAQRRLLVASAERGGWLPRALGLQERERVRVSVADLRDDVRAVLLDALVRLHGAPPCPLRALVADWGVGVIGGGPAELLLTPGPPIPIGQPLPQPDPLYVPMKLRSTVYVKDTVLKDDKLGDLFLISGTTKDELSKAVYDQEYVCTVQEARSGLQLAQFIVGEGRAQDEITFKEICANQRDRSVHWLMKTNEGLLWMASEGENYKMVDAHVEFESMWAIRHKKTPVADVDQLLVRSDQMQVRQVVCDAPGAGKSALLRYVAERARTLLPGCWVVALHMGRLRTRLDALRGRCVTQDAVLELVHEAAHVEREAFPALSHDVLKTLLWGTGDAVVLVDALDQAAPECSSVAQDVLGALARSPVAVLWVATRRVTRALAEEALATRAAELQPLDAAAQDALLAAAWARGGADARAAAPLAEALLRPLRARCPTDAGAPDPRLPLTLRLLADAFQEEATLGDEADLPGQELSTFELCATLVEKKFQRYSRQAPAMQGQRRAGRPLSVSAGPLTRSEWLEGHSLCALAEVLKPRQLEKLSIEGRRERVRAFCEDVAAAGAEAGAGAGDTAARLVRAEGGEDARFEQHALAEYLAARWLAAHWEERADRVVAVYFREDLEQLRTLFDRFVAAGMTLHEAVLDRTILTRSEAWIREQGVLAEDRAGRTALHLAAQSGRPELVSRLLAAGAPLEERDALLRGTPLYYAARTRCWDCAAALVARGARVLADVSASRAVQRLLPRGARAAVARYEVDWQVLTVPKWKHNPTTVLHLAAAAGNAAVLAAHLRPRPRVNARDGGGWAPLHWAVRSGCAEAARLLLDDGGDADVRAAADGYAPLHLAAQQGDAKMARLLLDRAADVRAVGRDGRTALHLAAERGQARVLDALLQAGAEQDINLADSRGETALHIAVEKGDRKVAEQLLRAGADGSLDGRAAVSPFFWAVKKGHLDLVRLMLELRIDGDRKGSDGRTPLHWAAWKGHARIAKVLLDGRVETGSRDGDGNTALHLAAREGHTAVARLLLSAGGDARAVGPSGRRPLHFAAISGSDGVAEVLLAAGADPDAADDDGDAALHLAARNGFVAVVRLLLKAGARSDVCGKCGRNPLHWAVLNNHAKVVEELLDSGANLEAPDKHVGDRALHMAACCGHSKVLRLLLRRGAWTSAPNADGRQPLHSAAERDDGEAAKLLLQAGADAAAGDAAGEAPLHTAARAGALGAIAALAPLAGLRLRNRLGLTPLQVAEQAGRAEAARMLRGLQNAEEN